MQVLFVNLDTQNMDTLLLLLFLLPLSLLFLLLFTTGLFTILPITITIMTDVIWVARVASFCSALRGACNQSEQTARFPASVEDSMLPV